MALIVGLGNPGIEYSGTRHNIGFELIDRIADVLSITIRPSHGPFHAGEGTFKGEKVVLIKPITFMNRSGTAVKKAIEKYHTLMNCCLICYDDINLETGKIRIRPGGSAGGHNGLSDIVFCLGSDEIPRLRIGIGNDFARGRQSEYVLSPFTEEERVLMDEALEQATEAVITFIRDGIDKSMNQFNM